MDRSDDNLTLNTHVKTGDPVTFDEAVQHEQDLRAEYIQKKLDQEAKKEMSNTDAGAAIKQQLIANVMEVMDGQMEQQRTSGKRKATWYARGDFEQVNPHLLADMTLAVTIDCTANEMSLRKLNYNLGKQFSCLLFGQIVSRKKQGRKMIKRLDKTVIERSKDTMRRADMVWAKAAQWGYDLSVWEEENECVKVGQILCNNILKGTNLIEIVKEKREGDTHLTTYPVFTETAMKLMEEHQQMFAHIHASLPVMLHPPRDWNADNLGPYLSPELQILVPPVRNMSPDQKAEVDELKRNGDLDAVFEALNFIQKTPYKINEYVLDALEWLRKEATKADELKKFPELIKAPAVERLDTHEYKALPIEKQKDRNREYNFITRYNRAVNANKTALLKHIATAKKHLIYDKLWLPHNFDYRGRVYHIPDFGPHNGDCIRALFLFANAKPIGNNEEILAIQIANRFGLDKKPKEKRIAWVKKHSDTIYRAGQDFKASYPHWSKASEPLQYLAACREWFHYKNIGPSYESGLPANLDATQSGIQHFAAASLNPDDGQKVNIRNNKAPHDFYEDCLNIAKRIIGEDISELEQWITDNAWTEEDDSVIKAYDEFQEQPYPEDFDEARDLDEAKAQSHREFKQTSTYTKQQKHRDLEAAKNVLNLGDEYDRGVIKRNAMTYSYSSRRFGFAEQLRSDWMNDFTKEVRQGKRQSHPFGKDRGYHAAFYLAGVHERAIEETVSSAADGMNFLQEVATILAKDASEADLQLEEKALASLRRRDRLSGRHFRYQNGMGFPFYQYYRESSSKAQRVFFFDRPTMEQIEQGEEGTFNRRKQAYYRRYTDKVERDKTKQGISPNTIHSQDGCHLLMTALELKYHDVDSIMVIHDSFATTIADTPKLDKILREQFKSLYSTRVDEDGNTSNFCLFADILEQAKLIHSDPDSVEWPQIPRKGNEKGELLDLNEVLLSPYFFN